ncbi:MAG: hypothetical protein KIT56_00070 [Gammaproteobacteria bacterium]|nr:hypothetical protein [Gammaproteobacteria bacterium]MCW5582280.1 hypothetical protein [Gammaproteobacteria bacterium]
MQQRYFVLTLAACCLFYFISEYFYHHYTMLAVDEFWFAHRIYQYKDSLPYRDFAPYKTVLGYYLLLIPMLFTHDIMQSLMVTKNFIALVNASLLFISSLWLSKFFSRAGILTSLFFLISSEILLSYASQIRVDLLGYWFCFFSLLLLLENRFLLAGMVIGLGFITTQKAIWHIFASNVALIIGLVEVYWFRTERTFKPIKNIVLFNLTYMIIIISYLMFWSWVSDWHTVFNSVFNEASAMYHLDWYNAARLPFWKTITLYNPLLFLLWPTTLFSLFITYQNDQHYHSRAFIVIYVSLILFCLIPFKQVFPYYMQVTIPIFFALYATFFTWLFDIFSAKNNPKLITKEIYLWSMLVIYLCALLFLVIKLQLPKPYLLIGLIPCIIITYITSHYPVQKKITSLSFQLILITATFIGVIYPCLLLPAKINYLHGAYQKANIQAINMLLNDGSDYVAGIELIYNKTQPIPGLRHLMGPAIDYLYAPTPKLKSVMLASLYEDPNATVTSTITALKKSSVKFYVNNYRIMALPPQLKTFLHSQYAHWWGSIYLYSPKIAKEAQVITLKFSGRYRIESEPTSIVYLNGKRYANHYTIYLNKGNYQSKSTSDYRLQLMPDDESLKIDAQFKNDSWKKMIF